jgi:GNAT superfamily N-acetyltransferase
MITKKREGSLMKLQFLHMGTLVGYYLSPLQFHVTNVFVLPEWRNQGIATALFQRLFYELKKNHVHTVTLDDCSDTGRCYQKLGFQYVKEGYPEMRFDLFTNKHE